jgi:ribosomal protein S18 acetylase RimI-like enzyme
VASLLSARSYEADGDLRLMQELVAEVWADRREKSAHHVGDLAWWTYQHVGREREWRRQLWLDGTRCVAWAWLDGPAELTFEVQPHSGLHDVVLDWFESEAEGDGPLAVWALGDDADAIAVLERRGFARPADGRWYAHYALELDAEIASPSVPPGYTLRTVRGEEDLHERVEIHRAVWNPSRVTEKSYRNVMAAWPYRPDLDCVVEAADGGFASYVLCWYDEANRAGEFEPVGTHPDHQRKGLAAATCRFALSRLHEEGARTAVVYAGGRDADVPARALYESVGFHRHARFVELRRSR